MPKVIGVKFAHTLKIYDFLPGEAKLNPRDRVVVETTQGLEIGEVVYVGKDLKIVDPENPLKTIERIAGDKDLQNEKEMEESAKNLLPVFSEKVEKFGLKMNPVGVSYSLDGSKAIFYFTADGRVDFRELAKDLSRAIQKQAVMRQIGPRDEAKLIGGYGRCGRRICCATFLLGSESVSMETVENQFGGPKNANKISGICGRLMCCLNYEEIEKKTKKSGKIEE